MLYFAIVKSASTAVMQSLSPKLSFFVSPYNPQPCCVELWRAIHLLTNDIKMGAAVKIYGRNKREQCVAFVLTKLTIIIPLIPGRSSKLNFRMLLLVRINKFLSFTGGFKYAQLKIVIV